MCVTVCAVLVLQLLVQPSMHSWAHWSKLALEVLVVAGLLITYGTGDHVRNWHQHTYSKPVWRATTVLIILASATNAGSGLLLVQEILGDSASFDTFDLLLSAGTIYVTNIVVFGLWYWHCDRGGQGRRAEGTGRQPPDFIFPQMTDPELADPRWRPRFVDYLYVSFTNAASFGPTDAMPSARWAKLAMMGQAMLALTLITLVVSRLVGLLS